jgi:hypothetical protein
MLWLCIWSVCLCSIIECEDVKAWMAWMEVVGGIYSLQSLPSRCLTLLSMGTTDSPVVHQTWHCSLSGACHVGRPLKSFVLLRHRTVLTSDFCTVHCSIVRTVDRWVQLTVASLAHRTVRWIIAEWLWENPRSASLRSASAWAPNSVRCATGCTNTCFAPNFVEFPNSFYLLVYVELYATEINDN